MSVNLWGRDPSGKPTAYILHIPPDEVPEWQAKAESEGCTTLAKREDVQLTDPFNLNNPNFLPKTGSPALSGTDFTGMDSFFGTTTYRGAFGTTNWMTGWASFTPKTNVY